LEPPLFPPAARALFTNVRGFIEPGAVLLTPRKMNDIATSFIGQAIVVEFRGSVMLPGRAEAVRDFYNAEALGPDQLALLDRYHVDYVAMRAEHVLSKWMAADPVRFFLRYRDEEWLLYHVRQPHAPPQEIEALVALAREKLLTQQPIAAADLFRRALVVAGPADVASLASGLALAYADLGLEYAAETALNEALAAAAGGELPTDYYRARYGLAVLRDGASAGSDLRAQEEGLAHSPADASARAAAQETLANHRGFAEAAARVSAAQTLVRASLARGDGAAALVEQRAALQALETARQEALAAWRLASALGDEGRAAAIRAALADLERTTLAAAQETVAALSAPMGARPQ
jgi:hypothetical protein